ncbi:hypothetical protein [Alkalihalobacillus sp. LMS39]|uniref:hypothetical protein n=1 Tax=Alkalihalobacillus sp. LMS39 TaxID=2924032 RepID=UPI001FB500C7|nr:hypothetical protein [Alkalihalobacillus sp. LMS39]UOE94907.1 hypothetical protein MM271_04450 [Alkalihalobacillus sp. LMS39]
MDQFLTLRILDKFKFIFVKMGVDYRVMRQILVLKLLMDQRRVPTVFSQSASNKKREGNQFVKSLWLYALLGLFLLPFLFLGDAFLFQMSLIYTIIMFFLMTSMISDFSTVLLDIRDKVILGTKPVSKRTMNAAKIVHILIYMFFLTAAIITIPLLVSFFQHGVLFFLLFISHIVLINLFIVVFTGVIYIVVLHFFDGERLKDMINYVQISLSIAIIIGYQLVIRSFDLIGLDISFEPMWWQLFIPPIWYAAMFEVFLHGASEPLLYVFVAQAIVIPFISIAIYIKLMPKFEQNLEKLANQPTDQKQKGRWVDVCAKLFCLNQSEKAIFRFASRLIQHEREFKLKVYPQIGLTLVIPFLFIFSELRISTWEEIKMSNWYFSIYFCVILIPTLVLMLKFSGTYKGSWIYKATPITRLESIYKGALKAVYIRLFFPIFLLLSVFFCFIFSLAIIPHLVIVFISSFLFMVLSYKMLNGKTLPFTESFSSAQQADGFKFFILFIIFALFAGIHIAVSLLIPYGVYIYLPLLLIITWFGWKRAFNVTT